MTLSSTKKLAASIFRLLKVTEIAFVIGRTNKGTLEVKFTSYNDNYEILLDSVPLRTESIVNDDNNIELKEVIGKLWFSDDRKDPGIMVQHPQMVREGESETVTKEYFSNQHLDDALKMPRNKGGRPKGSKNKQKPVEDKVNG